MEFKEITFKKGYYKEIGNVTTIFPINISWVKCDIVLDGGLHKNHTNYWTIIPDTITNRKWIIKSSEKYHIHSTYIFCGMILITIDNVAPIPEFEIVSWKELYNKYKLDKLTSVIYNENFDIAGVIKILEIKHPEYAIIRSFDFQSVFCQKLTNAGIHINMNLFKIIGSPFHGKSKILSGEKAEEVWNDAMTKFLFDFKESNISPKLQYESEYNSNDSFEENVKKVIEITNQFK